MKLGFHRRGTEAQRETMCHMRWCGSQLLSPGILHTWLFLNLPYFSWQWVTTSSLELNHSGLGSPCEYGWFTSVGMDGKVTRTCICFCRAVPLAQAGERHSGGSWRAKEGGSSYWPVAPFSRTQDCRLSAQLPAHHTKDDSLLSHMWEFWRR